MKNICIFMANGFEEIEALTVVDICRRADIKIITVSIAGRRQLLGAHAIAIHADEVYDNVDFSKMDGIVLPGGMPGTRYLQNDEHVVACVKKFADEGKLVAAICAAPSVLGNAGVLDGKNATVYPGFETPDVNWTGEAVVRDGNIMTGKGPGVAAEFALALVEYLEGKETADQLRTEMQMN